jgi:hypothetical protein
MAKTRFFSVFHMVSIFCLVITGACVPTMDEAAAPVDAQEEVAVETPADLPEAPHEPATEEQEAAPPRSAPKPEAAQTQTQTQPASKAAPVLPDGRKRQPAPEDAYLRVIVPNGPENWPVGSKQVIQWESRNIDGNAQIQLYKFGEFLGVLAPSVPIEAGQWEWQIPRGQGAGGNYNIYVVSNKYEGVEDSGEAEFELTFAR